MTDTKHLEHIALHLISFRLLKAGLLVASPNFDSDGADLLILTTVDENATFCKVQSKYRSLIRSTKSSIDIQASYITSQLVVFLFIDDGSENFQHLYCFFQEDVSQWNNKNSEKYSLSFTQENFEAKLAQYLLDEKRIGRIREILKKSDARKEIAHLLASQKNIKFNSIEISNDARKIVRLETTPIGTVPVIIDKATGIERYGSPAPTQNHDKYKYNAATDTWSIQ